MKTIYIFSIINSFCDFSFRNMIGKGELNYKTVNIYIPVKSINTRKQLLFSDIRLVANECRFKTNLFTSFNLVSNVSFTTTIVSHKHCCQMRNFASVIFYNFYFCSNLFFYLYSYFFAIDQIHSSENYYYIREMLIVFNLFDRISYLFAYLLEKICYLFINF